MREPSVIIASCGAISASGCGLAPLRDALQKNSSGLHALEKFASPRFQSSIVGAVPASWWGQRVTETKDPAWELASEALRQARDAVQPTLNNISAARIGCVLSTTKANITALEVIAKNQPCPERARRHLQPDLLAADLAQEFGAHGPVQTVSVACVSGLVAIAQGMKLIQRNAADAVLVVGVDALSEFIVAGFTALKAIDPQGCRPFDAARCGLSPGEAGAAMVLVREDLMPTGGIKIRSFGSSNDANHLTGPSRDGSGLAQAIRSALKAGNLSPDKINFVHAHGTGTSYNDAMESLALKTIFGDACPPVSGSKGMLGHTLGASGLIETIICVLAMQGNFLPGTPRLATPAENTPK
ncbi:MAG TPA: beta-ketoacyl-[acyl-carrier-protein] synthase family protein, partial [Verrucomicrobiae bacterium]